jgi:hypothetical protein
MSELELNQGELGILFHFIEGFVCFASLHKTTLQRSPGAIILHD